MKLPAHITRAQVVTAIATAIEAKESYVNELAIVDLILQRTCDYRVALRVYMPDAEWEQASENLDALNIYDEGYNAGWDGKYAHQNPHLTDGEAHTAEAELFEQGRFDGRRDRRD
jgi:hypothetical protein